MTDDLKAPERIWEFDRYVNGVLMAEGVTITRASSFEEACVKAAKLASRGPNNEAPVLVLGHRVSDRIAVLEAALADMTQQRDRQYDENCGLITKQAKTEAERDAAMAFAVKVKPLVWSQVNTYGSEDVWDALGGGHVYRIIKRADGTYWLTDPSCGSPYHKTLSACQDAANALHEVRTRAMWQPDPDRMLALTAAARKTVMDMPSLVTGYKDEGDEGTVEWVSRDDVLAALDTTNAIAALSRIEAQAEARGMRKAAEVGYHAAIEYVAEAKKPLADRKHGAVGVAGFVRAEILAIADATEAAAKGGV